MFLGFSMKFTPVRDPRRLFQLDSRVRTARVRAGSRWNDARSVKKTSGYLAHFVAFFVAEKFN